MEQHARKGCAHIFYPGGGLVARTDYARITNELVVPPGMQSQGQKLMFVPAMDRTNLNIGKRLLFHRNDPAFKPHTLNSLACLVGPLPRASMKQRPPFRR